MRIFFLGDIVGKSGRLTVIKNLQNNDFEDCKTIYRPEQDLNTFSDTPRGYNSYSM